MIATVELFVESFIVFVYFFLGVKMNSLVIACTMSTSVEFSPKWDPFCSYFPHDVVERAVGKPAPRARTTGQGYRTCKVQYQRKLSVIILQK